MTEPRSARPRSRLLSNAVLGALLVSFASFASACAGSTKQLALPAPIELGSVDAGDVFEMHIMGEEKLPTTYAVAPDGTVDLPYIHRVHVAGLEPQEIAVVVRDKLVAGEIFADPVVAVAVKEYASKRIEVLGEVRAPGSVIIQPGMTLLRAISLSGGFNSLANQGRVTIRRKVHGGTQAATLSVDDIMANRMPDPFLQAGDSINVEARIL